MEEGGEIACYKQFLIFPKSFLEICTADKNKGYFDKGIMRTCNRQVSKSCNDPLQYLDDFGRLQSKKPFQNIVGEGKDAVYQQFLLFLQRFAP